MIPKIHYCLIISSSYMFFSCVLLYFVAVYKEHVFWMFPYISDTGALPPESCWFSQFMNTGSLMTYFYVYVRYLQINECNKRYKFNKWVSQMNNWSIWFGFMIGYGLASASNFQETVSLALHLLSAMAGFGSAAVYFIGQTIISYYTCGTLCTPLMLRLRLAIMIFQFISFGLVFGFAGLSIGITYMDKYPVELLMWTPEMPYYHYHLISVIFEWFMALTMCFYFMTFYWEIKDVTLRTHLILPDQFEHNIGLKLSMNDRNETTNQNGNNLIQIEVKQQPLLQ